MKYKINIVSANSPIQKTNQQGKPYTIYSWLCHVKNEQNQLIQGITVKTFSQKIASEIQSGKTEFTGEMQSYNGVSSLLLKDEGSGAGKPFQKRDYKKHEFSVFESLVLKCWELSGKLTDGDKRPEVFEKILGCSTLIVDPEKINSDASKAINNKIDQATNQLNNVFNANPWQDETIVNDDMIPDF